MKAAVSVVLSDFEMTEAAQLTDEQVAEFKEAFALFDKDGDGQISQSRWNCGLREVQSVVSISPGTLKCEQRRTGREIDVRIAHLV